MNMLLWLLSEFGGWLLAGLGLVVAWFGLQARGERKAEARVQADNARVREEMARVERPKSYEALTRKLRGRG